MSNGRAIAISLTLLVPIGAATFVAFRGPESARRTAEREASVRSFMTNFEQETRAFLEGWSIRANEHGKYAIFRADQEPRPWADRNVVYSDIDLAARSLFDSHYTEMDLLSLKVILYAPSREGAPREPDGAFRLFVVVDWRCSSDVAGLLYDRLAAELSQRGARDAWLREYEGDTRLLDFVLKRGFEIRERFEYEGLGMVTLGKDLRRTATSA